MAFSLVHTVNLCIGYFRHITWSIESDTVKERHIKLKINTVPYSLKFLLEIFFVNMLFNRVINLIEYIRNKTSKGYFILFPLFVPFSVESILFMKIFANSKVESKTLIK